MEESTISRTDSLRLNNKLNGNASTLKKVFLIILLKKLTKKIICNCEKWRFSSHFNSNSKIFYRFMKMVLIAKNFMAGQS